MSSLRFSATSRRDVHAVPDDVPEYRLTKRATAKETATFKPMFERDKAELLAFGIHD